MVTSMLTDRITRFRQRRTQTILEADVEEHGLGDVAVDRPRRDVDDEERLTTGERSGTAAFLLDPGDDRPLVIAKIDGQPHQPLGSGDVVD